MKNARIKKWVPPYTPPGEPDLFYINSILAILWREPDGSLPRLGNPEDPLDDLIYLMLTRRGQIRQAQQLFEPCVEASSAGGTRNRTGPSSSTKVSR